MMTHENLKGRVAVVTGGGGVLCGSFAKTLANFLFYDKISMNWEEIKIC